MDTQPRTVLREEGTHTQVNTGSLCLIAEGVHSCHSSGYSSWTPVRACLSLIISKVASRAEDHASTGCVCRIVEVSYRAYINTKPCGIIREDPRKCAVGTIRHTKASSGGYITIVLRQRRALSHTSQGGIISKGGHSYRGIVGAVELTNPRVVVSISKLRDWASQDTAPGQDIREG